MALVSTLWALLPPCVKPSACARLPLQLLQRLGSFLNCLSWKKSCSPAVNTKSAPQSTHLRTLSWNSIESAPLSCIHAQESGQSTRLLKEIGNPRSESLPPGSAQHGHSAMFLLLKTCETSSYKSRLQKNFYVYELQVVRG